MIKNIELNISGNCNLRCPYCYANHGAFKEGEGMMDIKTVRRSIDRLFKWMGKSKHGTLYFFGGEPLLNWEAIVFAVEYSKKLARKRNKTIGFSISTNGTLLDRDNVAFMRKNRFSILLSIDSHRQSIHDALRPSLDKSSSFKKIIKALKLFKPRDDLTIRSSVTEKNLDIKGYVQHFIGYESIKNMIFVPAWPKPGSYSGKNILPLYKKAIAEYLDLIFKNWEKGNIIYPFNFTGPIYMAQNLKRIRQPSHCAAGKKTVSISVRGDIYLCALFTGIKEFYLGNLKEGIKEHLLKSTLQNIDLSKKKKCQKCFAKLACGGGCHGMNYIYTGRVDIPCDDHCELFKFHLECGKKIVNKIDELLSP